MNVLGLVFKVEEISTAVSSLNKQICCTYEKISKKKKKRTKQPFIYFFLNVYLKIAIKLNSKGKQDIHCYAEFNPWPYRSCKSF